MDIPVVAQGDAEVEVVEIKVVDVMLLEKKLISRARPIKKLRVTDSAGGSA